MTREPDIRAWEDLFNQVPASFAAVLQAIFLNIDTEERDPRAKGKMTSPHPRTMQDVHDVLWPRFTTEPFTVAIHAFLKPSLRGFAGRAGFNVASLHRMVHGVEPLSCGKLEQVAAAAKVSPAYFLEYRQMKIAQAVTKAFNDRPTASITAYKILVNPVKDRRNTAVTLR
jgi:hypothetical protein